MMTEGTGQGVHGRKTNVGRLYDLLVENGNQRINLEAGPGTRAFRHFGGTFFGTDAMSIVNHHQNWFLNHAPRTGALKIFLFGFSRGALIMRVVADWLCNHAIADVALDWILEPAIARGLKVLPGVYPIKQSNNLKSNNVIHDSLHEPTNGWGLLDPVKRALGGVKRHSLCDIIQLHVVGDWYGSEKSESCG